MEIEDELDMGYFFHFFTFLMFVIFLLLLLLRRGMMGAWVLFFHFLLTFL